MTTWKSENNGSFEEFNDIEKSRNISYKLLRKENGNSSFQLINKGKVPVIGN